jgi:hypothetical protein
MAQQTGIFSFEADTTPTVSGTDSLIALAPSAGTDFSSFAVLVRFNVSGYIEGINGAVYGADRTVDYVPGSQYHLRIVVNVPVRTYSLYVTAPSSQEVQVLSDYSFRSEQASVSQLSYWGHLADIGSQTVCNAGVSQLSCQSADTDCDGCVSQAELMKYITKWKSGQATLANLMEAISKWKKGC